MLLQCCLNCFNVVAIAMQCNAAMLLLQCFCKNAASCGYCCSCRCCVAMLLQCCFNVVRIAMQCNDAMLLLQRFCKKFCKKSASCGLLLLLLLLSLLLLTLN